MGTRVKEPDMNYIVTPNMVWTYIPSQNSTYLLDLKILREQLGQEAVEKYINSRVDLRQPFCYRDVQEDSAVFEGIEYVKEEKAYRFKVSVETILLEEKKLLSRDGKIWVGEDGLLRKMIVYDEKLQEVFSITFTDIVLNPEIPDSEFEFIPPKDCKIIDVTPDWFNRLKLIKELREK
ncbi:MAG: DUF2092 domain-containing protein [Candidatus Omnitrophica bacterium]|nr:DUF2092 domain-containing protein [Candidatus Omnitrophota bacterium]